jgi:hypothetical protein
MKNYLQILFFDKNEPKLPKTTQKSQFKKRLHQEKLRTNFRIQHAFVMLKPPSM